MDGRPPEMPFLKNIGLLMTYKCQVACRHCIIRAGPHRTEEMALEDAFDWIRQIANYRNGHIAVLSLTGGEPFYDLHRLRQISDFGRQCALFVSAVTNAYWASTPEIACKTLRGLPAIQMLSISTDVYHQQQIPFGRVQNAIRAAQACDIPFTVAVCTENETDPEYQQILAEIGKLTDPETILTAITFRAGRALTQVDRDRYRQSLTPPNSACGAGSSPIIFPDGRAVACIGPIVDIRADHPLVLGNLRECSLQEILDRAQTNPILHTIRLWGPRRLIRMIEQAGMGHLLPKTYIKDSICHACYDLMANPAIVEFFDALMTDDSFLRKVAYGRVYYLREPEMVQLAGIIG